MGLESSKKANLHEEQSSRHKRVLIFIVSLTIAFTFISVASVSAFAIHEHMKNPAIAIKDICTQNRDPHICFISISSLLDNNPNNFNTNPPKLFALSLQEAVDELANLSSITRTMISHSYNSQANAVLENCETLINESWSMLNKTMTVMAEDSRRDRILRDKEGIGYMKEKISEARNHITSCQRKLRTIYYSYMDEVKANVHFSGVYTDRSLKILDKFNPNIGSVFSLLQEHVFPWCFYFFFNSVLLFLLLCCCGYGC